MNSIQHNLLTVHDRIAAACRAAGRDPQEVRLLAVSKTFGPDAVALAHAAGQDAFGENYIQEAVEKMAALAHLPLVWHCIGPIQSNKTRLVAQHFSWVHTIDRLKVAERLNEQRPEGLPPLQVCVQVNVDGGASKSGVPPEQAAELAHRVAALPRLQLRGLMCIPEPAPDFTSACAVFTRVRRLAEQLRAEGLPMDTLSMGMTSDLEAAIHAGSTLVRVGTAIFGGRNYATA